MTQTVMAHDEHDDGTAKTFVRPVFVPAPKPVDLPFDSPERSAPPVPVAAAPGTDPLIGAQLGEYEVTAFLGSGGMGDVYRGVHPVIGRPVAIKVMRREFTADPAYARRFLEEARSVSAARHPGIVDVFSFGVTPSGQPYLVMELLEGESLDVYLQDRGALPVREALALFIPMMQALGAAHAAGVIHRDLKPANVFIVKLHDGSTFPKLVDFGLARRGLVGGVQHQTSVAGTPAYFAPEQARGQPVEPGTDLYGFGCLAYEVLTGQPPFTAVAYAELLEAHLTQAPRPLRERVPTLPEALDALVLQLLEKDVAKRPASALEVRQRLEAVLVSIGGAPLPHSQPSLPAVTPAVLAAATGPVFPKASMVAPARPRWPLAVGAVAVLAVAVGLGLWARRGADTPAMPSPPVVPAPAPTDPAPGTAPTPAVVTGTAPVDPTKSGGATSPEPQGVKPTGVTAPAATSTKTPVKTARGGKHTEAELQRKRQQLRWRINNLPDHERPKALLRLHDNADCTAKGDACWQDLLDIEQTWFPK